MSVNLNVAASNEPCDYSYELMRKCEEEVWSIVDNSFGRIKYNKATFVDYVYKKYGHVAEEYCRRYIRDKKKIPTAGTVILYTNAIGFRSILLIKNRGTSLFSLPKGKQENGETLLATAIRETYEETGLDLSDVITDDTKFITVNGARLYIVHSDTLIDYFSGYNKREIIDIGWFNLSYIRKNNNRFSRQTINVVNQLTKQ